MQERGRRVPRLSPAVQVGVTVALLLFAAYCLAASFQIAAYARAADVLEKRLLDESTQVRIIAAEFTASPVAAEKIGPQLDKHAETVGQISGDIDDLALPFLAPYSSAAENKRALTAHAAALSDQVSQLSASAEYVNRRSTVFDDVEKALGGLGELSEKTSIAGVRKVVRGVRSDLEAATERMRSETASSPVLYSNTHLQWRLSELTKRLREVESAVAKANVKRIEKSLEQYAEFLNSDWGVALVSHDRRGLQSLEAAAQEVQKAAEAAEEASVSASSAQYLLIAAALLSLVAAALLGLNLILRDREA